MGFLLGSTAFSNAFLGSTPIQVVYVGVNEVWTNERVVTLASSNTVNVKNLFSAADWTNPLLRKRVVIPAGVTIGTTSSGYAIAATTTADGQAGSYAGELILDVYGTVSGIGGAANSGAGGDVILGNHPGRDGQKMVVNLHPGGILRAGGGGGGKAGNGGGGMFQTSTVIHEPAGGGFQYTTGQYQWSISRATGTYNHIYWAGKVLLETTGFGMVTTQWYDGSMWTYYRDGVSKFTASGWWNESIRRQRTQVDTTNTNGGIAGNAGRGQGFDAALTNGAAAVAGGTNAGASGKSGNGGNWGAAGGAGASGANGNRTNGLAGAAGGLAGRYINGLNNIQFNNLGGTVLGRIA